MSTKIQIDEFLQLVERELPLVKLFPCSVERLEAGVATLTMPYQDDYVRPGGTVAGPVQMLLADLTLYAIVLSLTGPVPLAVTTNLNCHFLRRPRPLALRAEGRVLKFGQRLVVGEVSLSSAGDPRPVAHFTGTYSIPPRRD